MKENRTDLAWEAHENWQGNSRRKSRIPGVTVQESNRDGFEITGVRIQSKEGEKMLCKPIGRYITISVDPFLRREDESFQRGVKVTAELLRKLMGGEEKGSALVVGLGNVQITPDALGPFTARHVLATRHLLQQDPQHFRTFRPVSVLETGVLGTTGLESSEIVRDICRSIRPDLVIAVDALAGNTLNRLCRTIQIADTGIVPGSGIGNSRQAMNRETLGVPVIAVGVPTVSCAVKERDGSCEKDMIVTPRDIDAAVRDMSRFLGYAINLALQGGLTVSDLDLLIS